MGAGKTEDRSTTCALNPPRIRVVRSVLLAYQAGLIVCALDEASDLRLELLSRGSEDSVAAGGIGSSGMDRGSTEWCALGVATLDAPHLTAVVAGLKHRRAAWVHLRDEGPSVAVAKDALLDRYLPHQGLVTPVLHVLVGEQTPVVLHPGSLHLTVQPEWVLLLVVLCDLWLASIVCYRKMRAGNVLSPR